MAADRARIDLEQLTHRLLASRNRPKRQYLIQQIGRIWASRSRHCCLVGHGERHRHHHPPTEASLAAVASYQADPSPHVRCAVAVALGAHQDSARRGQDAMQRLLLDGDPIVRVVAANATRHRASQLPAELVRALLYTTKSGPCAGRSRADSAERRCKTKHGRR